jgi:hypothetical protein
LHVRAARVILRPAQAAFASRPAPLCFFKVVLDD